MSGYREIKRHPVFLRDGGAQVCPKPSLRALAGPRRHVKTINLSMLAWGLGVASTRGESINAIAHPDHHDQHRGRVMTSRWSLPGQTREVVGPTNAIDLAVTVLCRGGRSEINAWCGL